MLKKILLIILPLGTIAVVVWLVMPEYSALQQAKLDRTQAEEDLTKKEELIRRIKNLEAQYRSVADIAPKVAQIFPPTPNIPDLLVEIPTITVQTGMTLENLGFSTDESGVGSSSRDDSAPYKSLDADLALTGSYDSLKSFLAAVEKELRVMDVQSIQFSTSDNAGIFHFAVKVRMYYGLKT